MVHVSAVAWEDMLRHAYAESPRECCGLLLGPEDPLAVIEAWPARNDAEGHSRFLVNPADHFAAIRAARARGLDVIGAYHSHPRSAAEPSPTDLAEGDVGPWLHVIVSLASGPPDVRAYRYARDGAVTVPLRRETATR